MAEARQHAIRHIGTHVLPLGLGAGRSQVGSFAEEFGRRFRLHVGGPLQPIIESFDARISRFDGPETFRTAALLFAAQDERPVIGVPFMAYEGRERADVAQAIAHLVLHRPAALEAHPDLPLRVPYWPGQETDDGWRTAVRESHWFAWALLMPEAEFAAAWEREDGSAAKVAREFRVPSRLAELRAGVLGLAEAAPAMPSPS